MSKGSTNTWLSWSRVRHKHVSCLSLTVPLSYCLTSLTVLGDGSTAGVWVLQGPSRQTWVPTVALRIENWMCIAVFCGISLFHITIAFPLLHYRGQLVVSCTLLWRGVMSSLRSDTWDGPWVVGTATAGDVPFVFISGFPIGNKTHGVVYAYKSFPTKLYNVTLLMDYHAIGFEWK